MIFVLALGVFLSITLSATRLHTTSRISVLTLARTVPPSTIYVSTIPSSFLTVTAVFLPCTRPIRNSRRLTLILESQRLQPVILRDLNLHFLLLFLANYHVVLQFLNLALELTAFFLEIAQRALLFSLTSSPNPSFTAHYCVVVFDMLSSSPASWSPSFFMIVLLLQAFPPHFLHVRPDLHVVVVQRVEPHHHLLQPVLSRFHVALGHTRALLHRDCGHFFLLFLERGGARLSPSAAVRLLVSIALLPH